jgi:lipopolysaccharide export system protein LptA
MKTSRMFLTTQTLLSCCLLALLSQQTLALADDNQQPINIQSDRASQQTLVDGEKTEYFGNVVMTQGSMKINGDHIIIHSQQRQVTTIVAFGHPAKFEQQSDPQKAPVKAQANTINYQIKNETIALADNANIEQDGTIISGEKINYNIASEHVIATGGGNIDSRVKMVLVPASINATTDKSATDTPNKQPTPQDNKDADVDTES